MADFFKISETREKWVCAKAGHSKGKFATPSAECDFAHELKAFGAFVG